MSVSVTVRPGDSYSSPTWISSKKRRGSVMLVGGPDMAPHTPHRFIAGSPWPSNDLRLRTPTRPGELVALLMIAHTGRPSRVLLYRAHGESRDKPVEEEVVDNGDGDAGDEAGGHQRAPVVDVAAHQGDGHADADRHALHGGDEGEAVDELLDHQREREDHDREQAGHGQRQDDAPDGPRAAAPVHHGRLLDLLGQALEEPHQQPRAEGHREGRAA